MSDLKKRKGTQASVLNALSTLPENQYFTAEDISKDFLIEDSKGMRLGSYSIRDHLNSLTRKNKIKIIQRSKRLIGHGNKWSIPIYCR